jgi:glutamine synthetase
MIDLMPASMALLAPNVNSYRRFQPGMYVPTQASWGHNNRTVALRIPAAIGRTTASSIAWRGGRQPVSGDGGDFCRHSARAG